jgi:hypothetical protein
MQAATGAVWAALGAANLLALGLIVGATPMLGWTTAALVSAGAGIAVAALSALQVRSSLLRTVPAAGVSFAPPGDAVGRCLGPAALALLLLFGLAMLPDADAVQGLAAMLFLGFGIPLGLVGLWVRRFEETHGVLVAQDVSKLGVRRGPVTSYRLPR